MRKILLAALISGLVSSANAANLDNLRIGGFGSIGVGISNNDAGYAGYDKELDYKQDTLFGLQFDFQINDRASITTQVVANGRYNFEPAFEVAYLSYKFDAATVRGGKIRTPFFMYSDYLDVGYAYPMLRPSQEIYEHLVISSFTGIDIIIPVEVGSTTLELQPFIGVSQVEERDGSFGQQADIKDVLGVAANWYINDWTIRGSYSQATLEAMNPLLPNNSKADPIVIMKLNQEQDATFTSIGIQYNDGTWLFNAERMTMELSGPYYDVEAGSVLLGYQVNAFTPYVASSYIETSDNDERNMWPASIKEYNRTSYSVGLRWDFDTNIAMKLDTTYVDYNGTTGNIANNSTLKYDDSLVYSASIDFVF